LGPFDLGARIGDAETVDRLDQRLADDETAFAVPTYDITLVWKDGRERTLEVADDETVLDAARRPDAECRKLFVEFHRRYG
jgi:hypothetical protein